MVLAVARDARALTEQIRTIVDFLTDGRGDEDAEATASPGWRPRDWKPESGPCVAKDCATAHDHSPHAKGTPRWQSEIDGAVDRWPRYVVVGVPAAINQLPVMDRLIVRGVLVLGIGRTVGRPMSWVKVAEFAGCSDKTAKVHYDAALVEIAQQVWTDEGEPRW